MSLYVPAAFAVADFAAAARLIAAHPFATLITAVDGAAPAISHLPLRLEGDALVGHLARANPHWQRLDGAISVAVFHGPHTYVSPTAYSEPARGVPTWNYLTVHIEGQARLLDAAESVEALARLVGDYEPAGFTVDAAVTDRLLGGIVAFRIPVARWTAKFKLSQNRSAVDRDGVIAQLERRGRDGDQAVADWMRAHASA